jgi:hypothetical protein
MYVGVWKIIMSNWKQLRIKCDYFVEIFNLFLNITNFSTKKDGGGANFITFQFSF